MERESKYLMDLLGAYLREQEPPVQADIDWDRMLQLARIHGVTGILGYISMSYPVCPDPRQREVLRRACLDTIGLFARRAALAEAFTSELSKAGIDHIRMKGLVLRTLYPVPELRTFGDIDIVIRPEDRGKCHERMLSLGYGVQTDWEPVFSYRRGCEYYEIHTDIMEVDVSPGTGCREYFRNMWDYARPTGPHSYEFTPEYHFLYLLTHIAKHITGSGAGIRMYLDAAAMIRHYGDGLDWEFVGRELKTLRLEKFANVVLTAVEVCFGVRSPLPLCPVEEGVWNCFLRFTLEGGVFGKAGQDSGTVSLKNESRDGEKISRAGTFVRRLFPTAKAIRTRYTYLQDKPWLLPAAWIHRLIKTKDTWHQHSREAREILSADKDAVLRLRQLCEDIGL